MSTIAHIQIGLEIIQLSHVSKLAQGQDLEKLIENVSPNVKMDCMACLLETGNVLLFAPWDGGDSLMQMSVSMTPTVSSLLCRVQYDFQQSLRR